MLCCQKKPTLPMSLTHQGESSPVFQGLHGLGSGKLGLLVPPQSHPAVWPGARHFTSLSLSFLFCKMGGHNAGQARGRHGTTPASLAFFFFYCFFFKIILFICFWLCWVFVAAQAFLSLQRAGTAL